ncbi:MAG TPA: hypothetical protein EYP77_09010 [Anaerolineae bacterium]|nr:hypothetical protein [Anaerolineae bacterium]
MYQQTYYVDKRSNTYADVLVAYGLAAVLDEILAQARGRDAPRRIWIRDAGPYYTVKLPEPLQEAWVNDCSPFVLAPFVQTRKVSPPEGFPEGVAAVRDYEAGWERFRAYRQARTDLRKTAKEGEAVDSDAQRALDALRPAPSFWVLALVGDWRMQAISTYNTAVRQWWGTWERQVVNLKAILEMCAAPAVDLDIISKKWGKQIKHKGLKRNLTASQLFNPHQGKGQNRTKANALAMGNERSFWLLEYLKVVGLWQCAVPRTVRGGDDRKTYVLSPMSITLAAHKAVFQTFSGRLWNETAVKMDCVAALLYTKTLLEYSEAGQYDELDFEGYGPDRVVSGFHVTQYKLLSRNAYTALNLAFIGLPRWTGEATTREEVRLLKEVIEEHCNIISAIDETRSNGYNLLLQYRDFLSGRQLGAFFEFAVGYSQYLTSEWEAGHRWVRPFRTDFLGRLIVNHQRKLKEIIESQGFQNVAYAIRYSTIIPQGRKARGESSLYDIRYGLGRELKQKANRRDDFVVALGDFMQSYNAENAQKLESTGQQMRRDLRTGDVAAVVELVDEYGPQVVCNLLVAYGYAREPREDNTDKSAQE